MSATAPPAPATIPRMPEIGVQRQPLILRITHWLNALALLVMIGSGWRIYNWWPALPGSFRFPVAITLGGDPVLSGALHNEDGLATALQWHFAGMWLLVLNLIVYLAYGILSGHFRRDFLPLRPRDVARDFTAALRGRLDHHLGEYNAVQKLFYWGVIGLILVAITSGLAIWKPVQLQYVTAFYGGYDFARVVHFFAMAGIVGFLVVHLALTVLVPKTLLAMITGKATALSHTRGDRS
jgi:thiosulfate reductase cytochrome b subunit